VPFGIGQIYMAVVLQWNVGESDAED
jgi:hypothetical protein